MSYCKEQCSYYKSQTEHNSPRTPITRGEKCPMLRLDLLNEVEIGGDPDLNRHDDETIDGDSIRNAVTYLQHHAELDAEGCASDAQKLSPEAQAAYQPFDVVTGDQVIAEIRSVAAARYQNAQ